MSEKRIQGKQLLQYTALILLIFILFFGGLYYARQFLVPLSVAALLSMVVMPLVYKVEQLTGKRWAGAFTGSLTVFLLLAIMIGTVGFQVNEMADNWSTLKEKAISKIDKAENWIIENTPVSDKKLKAAVKRLRNSTSKDIEKLLSKASATFTDSLLILIYMFMMIFYRHKFRKFIEDVALKHFKGKPDELIEGTVDVAQQYLAGKAMVVLLLAVLYAIGLSIVGIKYALLIAIISAFLSIIPYIGNFIGGGLAIILTLFTKGTFNSMLGVVIVFSIVQFFESYIFTPLVIQRNINLNPFFTILAVVLGGAIWGVPGMIVGIPYLAIIKLLFESIDCLNPAAKLLEGNSKDDDEEPLIKKVKKKIT